MPETHIQDFTDAGDPQGTDLLNIQRQTNGVWVNYAISVDAVLGGGIVEVNCGVQDVVFTGVPILSTPPAGSMYMIEHGYVLYTPGSVFDGGKFDLEFIDISTSSVHGFASFNFAPVAAVSHIYGQMVLNPTPDPTGAIEMFLGASTLADGDLKVWIKYREVFI